MNNFLEIRHQWIIIIKGNQEHNNTGTITMNKSFEELEFSSQKKKTNLTQKSVKVRSHWFFVTRCDHICNGGFIVRETVRGNRLGRWQRNNDHLAGKPIETRPSKQCEFCISLLDKSFDKSGLLVSCGCNFITSFLWWIDFPKHKESI